MLIEHQIRVMRAIALGADLAASMQALLATVAVQFRPVMSAVVKLEDDQQLQCIARFGIGEYANAWVEELCAGMAMTEIAAAIETGVFTALDENSSPNLGRYLTSGGCSVCWVVPITLTAEKSFGALIMFHAEMQPLADRHHKLLDIYAIVAGLVANRHRLDAETHRLAYYDPLTGLPNRRLFSERLQMALAARSADGRPLTVMFIDLDRFKDINDSEGHDVGDKVLQQIAKRIESCIGPDDTAARLGGDEFMLLVHSEGTDEELAQRLLEQIEQPIVVDDRIYSVSASIGMARFPDDGTDVESLWHHADEMMYRHKSQRSPQA